MRIRTKILASHAVLATTVALICIMIIATLRIADKNRRELSESYQQLRNIDLIAIEASHYIEQIAELIIVGPQGLEREHTHSILVAHIAKQRDLVLSEIDWLTDAEKRAGELREIDLIRQIEAVVNQLDAVYEQIAAELAAGRREMADALYRDEVENRLDEELGALIEQALARELSEVEESLAASARLSRQSIWLASGVVLIVIALGAGNVAMLNRTVLRPVTALAKAADAVGRGDLAHIVETGSADELGNLAQRFNRMTRQIREQRDTLHHANQTLERQVTDRTRELLARTQELETVNERLREIDASRTQFFADISHELRTPLTILRGQAEVALRRPDTDPAQMRETLEAIVRKVGQMSRLVGDLLFLARSEHGAVEIEMKPLILQELIGDILLDAEPLARRKGIVLAPQQPLDPLMVQGDSDRLRQAVMILLDNAIKFSPERSTIAIELARKGDSAMIRVHDDGPGFSAIEKARAFSRFYRGDPRRKQNGGGAGLGLAIAKWIVDRHAGTIGIDNTLSAGATITIEIPMLAEAA